MASKRRTAPPDSLELLLDTICNTFGGVLFMAILVAVLIRTSSTIVELPVSEPRPKVSSQELHRANAELSKAMSERESLVSAVRIQRDLAAKLAPPEVRQELELRNESDADEGKLLTESKSATEAIAEVEAKIEQVLADLASLANKSKQAAIDLANSKKDVEREVRSRTQTSTLPRLRSSSKREIGLIVRFGKLYVWHRYDGFGRRTGINTDDMAVVEDGPANVEVSPIPFAGTLLADDQDAQASILRILRRFNSQEVYYAVIVYDDSFGRFRHLKQAFIDSGFEYRLMPKLPGEVIRDRGGSGGSVQ